MNHPIKLLCCEELIHKFDIGNVPLNEGVPRIVFNVSQVLKIPCICEFVEVYDLIISILQEVVNEIGANKTSSSRYQYFFYHL